MSIPRKHHFCPAFYLSFFTMEKMDSGTLHIFDKYEQVGRKGKPKNEAHQRDFYRLDVIQGEDPYVLEKELAKIEAGAKNAIDYIQLNRMLPGNDDDFSFLINFIGIMTVRIPHYRKRINHFHSEVSKRVMQLITANENRWDSQVQKLKSNGTPIPNGVTFQSISKFVKDDNYDVIQHQNESLKLMLSSASTVIDLLFERKWTLLFAPEDCFFVSSDNPIGLRWIEPVGGFFSPGFGVGNTQVTVPLTSKIALVGLYEDKLPDFISLDRAQVASFNTEAISRADRFVYSPTEDFIWKKVDETIGQKSDLSLLLTEIQKKKGVRK